MREPEHFAGSKQDDRVQSSGSPLGKHEQRGEERASSCGKTKRNRAAMLHEESELRGRVKLREKKRFSRSVDFLHEFMPPACRERPEKTASEQCAQNKGACRESKFGSLALKQTVESGRGQEREEKRRSENKF